MDIANKQAANSTQADSPEAQMVMMEGKRLELEAQKIELGQASELAKTALKNRELTLQENKLEAEMFTQGAKGMMSKMEKEADRAAAKSQAAMDNLVDLNKQDNQIKSNEKLESARLLTKAVVAEETLKTKK